MRSRIHAPLNQPEYYDELLAFQGASYFRGLGKKHSYGLSARATALNTEGPEQEEFPSFRSFWIERPTDRRSILVHALLDSPSLTGAYSFLITPGAQIVWGLGVGVITGSMVFLSQAAVWSSTPLLTGFPSPLLAVLVLVLGAAIGGCGALAAGRKLKTIEWEAG